MTSLHATPTSNNALVMMTIVPLTGQISNWLKSDGKNVPPKPASTLKNGKAVCHVPSTKGNTNSGTNTKSNEKPASSGLQGTMWEVVRRLQNALSEEDCQVARKAFGVDETGQFSLSLPGLPSLFSLSSLATLPLLSSLPELPHQATYESLLELVGQARDQLPTVVGVAACSAALICRQPGLGLHYAIQRVEDGLRPWLGTSLAGLAAQPAAILAAAGGIPLVLTAIPAYYGYLVVAEARRQAIALGGDAQQLATIVQLIAARCEPIFREADGLPVDAVAHVVALGLRQHLPNHVASVVQQAIYVGELTGNLSPRLASVLRAAADWAHGEQGLQLLDDLVRMTEPNVSEDDAPRAA